MTLDDISKKTGSLKILYDGECPFCKNFVRFMRFRENVSDDILLIDVRQNQKEKGRYIKAGYDFNEGMIVDWGGDIYYADQAVYILGILSSNDTFWSKLNRLVFKSQKRAKFLYPILKCGRRVALKILGRSSI